MLASAKPIGNSFAVSNPFLWHRITYIFQHIKFPINVFFRTIAVIDFQKKYHVPIFVGEFSVISWAPVQSAVAYLKDLTDVFQKYGWSWTYHAFREYQGWSLEYEDGYMPFKGKFKKAKTETARAKVIKAGLAKNIK